jgi:hypothetical protein
MYTGIFAQASKSLDEYRSTIAKQTEQITSLEEATATSQQKLEEIEVELNRKTGMRILTISLELDVQFILTL